MKTLGNRIFVLDNLFDTSGNGVIHVIKAVSVSPGVSTYTFEYPINSSSFAPTSPMASNKINDFEIKFNVTASNGFIVATISNVGLGYASFNSSDSVPFNLTGRAIVDLINRGDVFEYQAVGTQFLQL